MKSQRTMQKRVNPDEIRALAYQLWQAAQCPIGRDLDFWFQAERQLGSLAPGTSGQRRQAKAAGGAARAEKATTTPRAAAKKAVRSPGNHSKKAQPRNVKKAAASRGSR